MEPPPAKLPGTCALAKSTTVGESTGPLEATLAVPAAPLEVSVGTVVLPCVIHTPVSATPVSDGPPVPSLAPEASTVVIVPDAAGPPSSEGFVGPALDAVPPASPS